MLNPADLPLEYALSPSPKLWITIVLLWQIDRYLVSSRKLNFLGIQTAITMFLRFSNLVHDVWFILNSDRIQQRSL